MKRKMFAVSLKTGFGERPDRQAFRFVGRFNESSTRASFGRRERAFRSSRFVQLFRRDLTMYQSRLVARHELNMDEAEHESTQRTICLDAINAFHFNFVISLAIFVIIIRSLIWLLGKQSRFICAYVQS